MSGLPRGGFNLPPGCSLRDIERAMECETCGGNGEVYEYYGLNGPHRAPCPDCQPEEHAIFWTTYRLPATRDSSPVAGQKDGE